MSNELEHEILLYDQFEREQQSQETQKLCDIIKIKTGGYYFYHIT